MKIEKSNICPLIKIKSPDGVDFFQEHTQLIEKNGFVCFCRFGKNNMKLETLKQYAPYIIIKESGIKEGGVYLAKYTDITDIPPDTHLMPLYYNTMASHPSLCFKVIELYNMEYSLLTSSFVGKTSGENIQSILKSMCPAFFVKCISTLDVYNCKGDK